MESGGFGVALKNINTKVLRGFGVALLINGIWFWRSHQK